MANRLRNLLVAEVSLVDKGANNKRFYLMKAAEKNDETPEGAAPTPAVEPTLIEKALSTAVDGEAADADPSKDLTVALRRVAKASGLDEAGLKAALGLKDPEPVAKAEAPKDPLADLPAEAKAHVEALFKAQAEAIAKAEELTKALEAEREAKAVAECIQKAAADFKCLPAKAEDLGPALRAVRKAVPQAADVIEAVLKSANALAGQALEPKGVSAASTDAAAGLSTYEKVVKRAEALVAKGECKTIQAGVDRIFNAEPDLYAAHVAETKKG